MPESVVSAERNALANARISGTCMAMGQAAGTVAAIAATSKCHIRALEFVDITRTLLAQGAVIA